jgi:hypothetical protein
MVVLYKVRRQAQGLELVLTIGFHKETASILENLRD